MFLFSISEEIGIECEDLQASLVNLSSGCGLNGADAEARR